MPLLEFLCCLLQTRNAGQHLLKLFLGIAAKALNNLAQKAHNRLQ